MNDQQIEHAIIDAGANVAPRVSADQIDTLMGSLRYESWVVPDTTTTVVVAILPNGFTVGVGKSASVSKDNFNDEIGFSIAKDEAEKKARDKLWELEGYALSKALLAKEKDEAEKKARDKLWELECYALSKALLAKEEAK